jgi:diaminopropionate ammonia-lyase
MKGTEANPGIRILRNKNYRNDNLPEFLKEPRVSHIRSFHETVPGYRATPLARLDSLAEKLGVGRIYVKDESKRFGLNAFKSLGGIYAVTKVLCRELGLEINNVSYADLQTPEIKEKTSCVGCFNADSTAFLSLLITFEGDQLFITIFHKF